MKSKLKSCLRCVLILVLVIAFCTLRGFAADPPKKNEKAEKAESDQADASKDEKDKDKDKDKDNKKDNNEGEKPTTKPTGTGKKPTAATPVELPAALTDAITKLKDEFDAAQGKDSTEVLRDMCDYFGKENPAGDITVDQVLAALEKNHGGKEKNSARADAYIKWQLLSAIPGRFEDAQVPKALVIYKNAPKPEPRLGATAAQRGEMNKQLRASVKTSDDIVVFNSKYAEVLAKNEETNRPMVDYRDALFDRLPISAETIAAGFDDVSTRLSAGADADEILETVCGAARTWALSGDATTPQLNKIASFATGLEKKDSPGYYTRAEFEGGQPKWIVLEPAKSELDALIKLLKDRAKLPKRGEYGHKKE